MDSDVVFQAWCRRDPALVFQSWRNVEEGTYTYAPRWATEACASESPWHAELLGYFLELPFQQSYVRQLWQERIQRAITACDDPRAVEWLRAGLDADLAPSTHALMVTMALSLNRPEWDSVVIEISGNERRDDALRVQALDLFVYDRVEVTDVPALIADAYVAERLPPGFPSKWVPMLLARADTREDMVVRGLDAIAANPRWELTGGELPFVLLTDVGAHSYRMSEPLRRRGEEAMGRIGQLPGVSYSVREAVTRAEAARRDSLNAEGRRVRRVPWEFSATVRDGACLPVWPERLRAFAERDAPGLRLVMWGDDCPGTRIVGDFDADGHDDVVTTAILDSRDRFVLVLGGESPKLITVANANRGDDAFPIGPGWFQSNCVEEVGWMPWDGFRVGATIYYVRDGRLVGQASDSC